MVKDSLSINESKDKVLKFSKKVFRNEDWRENQKSLGVQRRVALAESGGAVGYEYEGCIMYYVLFSLCISLIN